MKIRKKEGGPMQPEPCPGSVPLCRKTISRAQNGRMVPADVFARRRKETPDYDPDFFNEG